MLEAGIASNHGQGELISDLACLMDFVVYLNEYPEKKLLLYISER